MSIHDNSIQPDTLELLVKRAQDAGESVDDFLKRLLNEMNPEHETELSLDEWVKEFREWVSSHAHRTYGFVDDSRESIYREREDMKSWTSEDADTDEESNGAELFDENE